MGNALLITGASGFVGSHAVNYALESQLYETIIATDMRFFNPVPNNDEGFRFIQADITSPNDLWKIREEIEKIENCKLVVWHIGGCFNYSAPKELLHKVNVGGTKMLMTMLMHFKTKIQRLVFWSGGVVYGNFNHPHYKLPAAEEYPAVPQDDYGWSKKEAEEWLDFFHQIFSIPITIMRLGAIYGPNSRYGMAAAIFLNAAGKLAPLLVGDKKNMAGLIHAEDVVRVADFLSWAPEANGEIYNVVGDSVPVSKVAVFIGEQLNNKPFQHFRLPAWVLRFLIKLVNKRAKQLGGRPVIDPELGKMTLLNSWMSNKKLMKLAAKYGREKDLFRYPDPIEGLRETIRWYVV